MQVTFLTSLVLDPTLQASQNDAFVDHFIGTEGVFTDFFNMSNNGNGDGADRGGGKSLFYFMT